MNNFIIEEKILIGSQYDPRTKSLIEIVKETRDEEKKGD